MATRTQIPARIACALLFTVHTFRFGFTLVCHGIAHAVFLSAVFFNVPGSRCAFHQSVLNGIAFGQIFDTTFLTVQGSLVAFALGIAHFCRFPRAIHTSQHSTQVGIAFALAIAAFS